MVNFREVNNNDILRKQEVFGSLTDEDKKNHT